MLWKLEEVAEERHTVARCSAADRIGLGLGLRLSVISSSVNHVISHRASPPSSLQHFGRERVVSMDVPQRGCPLGSLAPSPPLFCPSSHWHQLHDTIPCLLTFSPEPEDLIDAQP